MVVKKTFGSILFDAFNYIFLILLALITIYPFLYIVFASLSSPSELVAHSGLLLQPKGFTYAAYEVVLKNAMILTGYKNTLIYLTLGTTLNIIMTSMGAYILSRKHFFWRGPIMTMVLISMFFGGGLIPTYLLIKSIGFYNNIWVMVIPGVISTWNLIIMRTYFASIPDSLEESAKIDGANDILILFKIILPLSLPIIAVMVLYYGVAHWNSWFNASIYLKSRQLYPLQLVLREIVLQNNTENMMGNVSVSDKDSVGETIKYATIMVATLPILCVYPFIQKYFVKGVMIGAVKG